MGLLEVFLHLEECLGVAPFAPFTYQDPLGDSTADQVIEECPYNILGGPIEFDAIKISFCSTSQLSASTN